MFLKFMRDASYILAKEVGWPGYEVSPGNFSFMLI